MVAERKKRPILRRVIAIAAVLLVAWVTVVYFQQDAKMKEQARQLAQVNEQVKRVEEENMLLERLIASKDTPEYIQRAARKKLGWMMPEKYWLEKNNISGLL